MNINADSSAYGFEAQRLFLDAGVAYTFSVTGYVNAVAASAGKFLRAYLSKEDETRLAHVDITATSETTATMTYTPEESGAYVLAFYMYDNSEPRSGKVHVSGYRLEDGRDLSVHVFPDVADTEAGVFVDGVRRSASSGLGFTLDLEEDAWAFHTVSFRTRGVLAEANAFVLFRLFPAPGISYRSVNIAMPKLEMGMLATGFIETGQDIQGEPGKDGERGPAVRGPQDWEECAMWYPFMAGGEGETFLDAVVYKGNYYLCMKSHTKTAENYPGSTEDTNSKLWRASSRLEFVATRLLLAEYALVKNLGVEAIEMKDAAGNIIFRARDGKVVCNEGEFNNVRLNGFLYKKKLTVTPENFADYAGAVTDEDGTVRYYVVDVVKTGSYIEFAGDFTGDFVLRFPSIDGSREYTAEEVKQAIELTGNSLVVVNNSENKIRFDGLYQESFSIFPGTDGTLENPSGIPPSIVKTIVEVGPFRLETGNTMGVRAVAANVVKDNTTGFALVWYRDAYGTL